MSNRYFRIVLPMVLVLAVAAFVGHGFLGRSGYAAAPGGMRDPAAAFSDGRPNLVAAMFYSAWCSSCAVIDPRLRHIAPEFDGRAVEFTKFDFSLGQPDSLTKKADDLGVTRVYEANKGTTGFLALIDRRNQRLIGMVTLRQSDEQIRGAIESAIKEASNPAI